MRHQGDEKAKVSAFVASRIGVPAIQIHPVIVKLKEHVQILPLPSEVYVEVAIWEHAGVSPEVKRINLDPTQYGTVKRCILGGINTLLEEFIDKYHPDTPYVFAIENFAAFEYIQLHAIREKRRETYLQKQRNPSGRGASRATSGISTININNSETMLQQAFNVEIQSNELCATFSFLTARRIVVLYHCPPTPLLHPPEGCLSEGDIAELIARENILVQDFFTHTTTSETIANTMRSLDVELHQMAD